MVAEPWEFFYCKKVYNKNSNHLRGELVSSSDLTVVDMFVPAERTRLAVLSFRLYRALRALRYYKRAAQEFEHFLHLKSTSGPGRCFVLVDQNGQRRYTNLVPIERADIPAVLAAVPK